MLGRWISDLQVGDELPIVDYVVTAFMVREYCHGVEEGNERFHIGSPQQPQIAPPTFVHTDKLRVLERACPEPDGPPRMQYEFDAEFFQPIPVGARVAVSGEVVERTPVKGRERLVIVFEVRDAATGELYTRYRDTTLLSFRPAGAP
jgi:hypothetical protein